MAFVQLLVAGLALSTRYEQSRIVQIKEVPKIVAVRVPVPTPQDDEKGPTHVVSRPPVAAPHEEAPLPDPTPVIAPSVNDPRSERMVKEARQARVAGDMGKAIMKLENALTESPDDPTVHYEMGLVHEQMGVFDVAAAHYEKVFQMGVSGAGKLYEMAASKLRDGFEQPDAMHGKFSLGRVLVFPSPESDEGQKIILTIPVQKAPGEEIEPSKVSVEVLFFNRTAKGEVVQLEDRSWSQEQWLNPPFDWADGEEDLRATYTIPPQDQQTEHLFGGRTYYGQVVVLHYGAEVLDVQANPRDLAAKISRPSSVTGMDPVLPDFPDFPMDSGVLPPK